MDTNAPENLYLRATRRGVIQEVCEERLRQDAKWGGPEHDDKHDTKRFAEFIGHRKIFITGASSFDPRIRKNLIEIAALAVAAVESLDRKAAVSVAAPPEIVLSPEYLAWLVDAFKSPPRRDMWFSFEDEAAMKVAHKLVDVGVLVVRSFAVPNGAITSFRFTGAGYKAFCAARDKPPVVDTTDNFESELGCMQERYRVNADATQGLTDHQFDLLRPYANQLLAGGFFSAHDSSPDFVELLALLRSGMIVMCGQVFGVGGKVMVNYSLTSFGLAAFGRALKARECDGDAGKYPGDRRNVEVQPEFRREDLEAIGVNIPSLLKGEPFEIVPANHRYLCMMDSMVTRGLLSVERVNGSPRYSITSAGRRSIARHVATTESPL